MYYFRIQAGLRKFTVSTTFVLKSCDFRAGVYFVYTTFVMNVLKTAPRKFTDGVRESCFSREDGVSGTRDFRQPSYAHVNRFLYLCVYAYIYIYIYVCMYIYIYAHILTLVIFLHAFGGTECWFSAYHDYS